MARDIEIDIAKGLGIIMIVFGHVSQWGLNMPLISSFFGVFAVPMFFFLSGVFFRPDRKFRQTVKSKFRRLYVPFVIANLLALVFELICGEEATPVEDVLRILVGLKVMPKVGPSWFVLVLLWSSLIYALADIIFRNRLVFLTAFCVVSFVIGILLPNEYYVGQIFVSVFLYHCGRMSHVWDVKSRLLGMKPLWECLITLLCAVAVLCVSQVNVSSMYANEYGNVFLFLFGAASGIVLITYACRFLHLSGFISKIISIVGRGSLWILLMHFAIIMGVFIVHGFMLDNNLPLCNAPMPFWYSLCILLSIFVPIALQYVWNKLLIRVD